MKKIICWSILIIFLLISCSASGRKPISPLPDILPKIDRRPQKISHWVNEKINSIATYDSSSNKIQQVDLRQADLSKLDLSSSLNALMAADFDTETRWPTGKKIPAAFDWKKIMELGKDPGLGIQELHEIGITGYGVGIAIIDQPLLVSHQEYGKQIRLYEETQEVIDQGFGASYHSAATASIAVGKTVGVAPEADLYFIGTNMCSRGSFDTIDFSCLAQSVDRILEINEQLPADRKIRVLVIPIGWDSQSIGYEEINTAAQRAKEAGLLVMCSNLESVHGFKFNGLGRLPLDDPDNYQSYSPGLFWSNGFFEGHDYSDQLMVPMDSRTTASPTGNSDYVFYRTGGLSWSIPYVAGIYALAVQVDPTITPQEFWSLAMSTGKTIELNHDGETILFGPILNPKALIEELQTGASDAK